MTFINQIFAAAIVARGGPVRRKSATVRGLGLELRLRAEVERRGFHMMEIGDQFVIMCSDTMRLIR